VPSELSSFTLDLWTAEPARETDAPSGGGLKWYQVRCGDGRPHPVRLAWEDGWLSDLHHLAQRQHGGAVLGRLGDRLGRLLAPTDWPGLVGQIQAARREGRKVRLTLRTNAEELLWLPWEAIPAGQGMATAALLGGPLRFAWASSGSPPRSSPTPTAAGCSWSPSVTPRPGPSCAPACARPPPRGTASSIPSATS
jgi:hypothetical protein